MADVARLAAVSKMTVSRLLAGTVPVAADKAKRIEWAIQKLGYRPNEVARALRARKARNIGVIVPYLYDSFFAICAHEIDLIAKEHGYTVMVASSGEDPAMEEKEAGQMLRRNVEGLVLIPAASSASYLRRPEFLDLPIVTIDRPVTQTNCSAVLVQNKEGARLGVEHLLQHGHKRIAFFGLDRDLYTMGVRYQGYRQAMTHAGLTPEPFIECTQEQDLVPVLGELLQGRNPTTAFFAANNLVTQWVLRAAAEIGLSVPSKVALIGFDDFELADLLQPPLTVVRQPVRDLGRFAAQSLFEQIKSGSNAATSKRIVLPVELVIRRSCGCRVKSAT